MTEKGLTDFFEKFLKKKSLFKNKKVLQANYIPKTIPHRKKEIDNIKFILAPSLKLEKSSNLFIYGKTGTGKSVVAQHVADNILLVAKKNKIPLKIIYINCKLKRVADTEYRLMTELAKEFGEKDVPTTGLATKEIHDLFVKALDKEKTLLILILDEIDQLVTKAGDEILYTLTRINSVLKNSQLSLVGISNDLMFTNQLDPRIKSSLSEEELLFPPYNALQLQSILKQRARLALKNGIITEGVIEKCAAYAAREHGDARRALDLLRVAVEVTERSNQKKITIKNLDEAQDKIERDRVTGIVKTQPKQSQIALLSIINMCTKSKNLVFTGEIYELYKEICFKIKVQPLTQRRVSDIIAELDMLGIINTKVISKGRYGRTREIGVGIGTSEIPKIQKLLTEALNL